MRYLLTVCLVGVFGVIGVLGFKVWELEVDKLRMVLEMSDELELAGRLEEARRSDLGFLLATYADQSFKDAEFVSVEQPYCGFYQAGSFLNGDGIVLVCQAGSCSCFAKQNKT